MKNIKRTVLFSALSALLLILVLTGCSGERGDGRLSYTLSEDGTYYVVSGTDGVATDALVIPATYEGLPVREIADGAFRGQKHFSSLRFEKDSTLSVIGRGAFEDCSGLVKVELPPSLEIIGADAFLGCRRMDGITLPDGLKSLGYGAFSYCKGLEGTASLGWTGPVCSHLVILGGYGLVSEDSENLTAEYTNLNQLATYACASYGSKWKVNLFAGYLKNFGTDKDCTALYGTGVNVADVIKTAASVEFNYKGLNVALECEYSNAAYAKYLEKKLQEDYRVGNIRGVLRVSYSFSHTWNFEGKK